MNTYQQAAEKLGISYWMLTQMISARRIARVKYGHRTCRITDAEIDRVKAKNTRRAIV